MSEKSRKKNKLFYKKHVFPQNVTLVTLNAVLEVWPDFLPTNGSKSITQNSELTRNSWCFQRKNSFQMFFWTFRMQFTQWYGKTLVKVMKKNGSESVIFETCLLFSKLIFSKFLSEHKKGSFNKPPVRLPPKVQRNITPKTKNEKTKFAAKSQNVPVETPIAV